MRTLSRAFAYAGCPSMIASSWNIPDQSSQKIFLNFCNEFINNNHPKDVALQNAKLKYIENVKDENAALVHKWTLTTAIGNIDKYESTKTPYWVLIGGGTFLLLLLFFFVRRRKSLHS